MFKDFDAMLAEKSKGRPEFTVGGQKFTARAKLPWKKFSSLILSMTEADSASESGVSKTEDFFRLVLVRADRQRFVDLMNADGDEDEDEDSIISPQQISELMDWLLEYYTGKALPSDASSLDEPSTPGVLAKPVSLSAQPTQMEL